FKNVPFGEGVVDFERCFETLKQSGYCGPYLIEMWSETAENPAVLAGIVTIPIGCIAGGLIAMYSGVQINGQPVEFTFALILMNM
ncbi:TIM barrel protein, partial [Salmonella enterica subsp. enterica serovar Montevideo]|nr:TIM barrel protein [Salmonella enterica subsp. enterica serovar Montevideo]